MRSPNCVKPSKSGDFEEVEFTRAAQVELDFSKEPPASTESPNAIMPFGNMFGGSSPDVMPIGAKILCG